MKSLFLFLVLVLSASLSSGQNTSINDKFDSFIEKGDSCLFLKKYDCVLLNYEQARKLKPNDPSIKQIFNSLILSAFEAVEYYPDSTIRNAYKIQFNRKNGYAVEYSSVGNPLKIGKYENDKKEGAWLWAEGKIEKFHAGESNGLINTPPSTQDNIKIQQQFQKLYVQLIASEKTGN